MRRRPVTTALLGLAFVLAAGACGADDDGATGVAGGDQPASPAAEDGRAPTSSVDGPATTGPAPTTTAIPTTSTTPAPSTTTAPPTTLAPTTTTTAPPEPMLQPGETSQEVALLQVRLTELGYRPGEPNGVYGSQTSSAVMAFQKREGLARDGVAGPRTLERLAAPQGPGPRRSGPGPWVEVDVARQVVFVADPAGTVFTLNTSTGSGQRYTSGDGTRAVATTPRGSFAVYRTVNATEKAPLGTLYRPMYFTGGYAVHGSPSVPGYPASHGCVRLSNVDTDWLWGFAGKGTPVDLYG